MHRYQISEVIPYYQPIVDLQSGKVVMYEALARFLDHNGSGISPLNMEQLFCDDGFSMDVFKKMLPDAVRMANSNIDIAVNIEASSLGNDFFMLLENVFERFPNIAGYLSFEVTERTIGRDIKALAEHIEVVRAFGAKVVLDDFGTGAANFECLEAIRFDQVKIDGQFLKGSANSTGGLKRLKLFVDLLKSYNVPIVGEHIENSEIEMIAKNLTIDYGQGYFYGKPSPTISNESQRMYA